VAAVAPLAIEAPGAGRNLGALWGVGHGGGVLIWIILAALFQRAFGLELPSVALEALVGVALLGLGLVNLRSDTHEHTHAPARGAPTALAMGALHGSAGASHLLALLPTLGLPGLGAFSYACGYLVAGVVAMASVGVLIARFAQHRANPARLKRICALSVIAIGSFWLITALRELA
jgi:hypothetical protein